MPSRTQARTPTSSTPASSTPTTAGPSTSATGPSTGGRLDRMQRTQGNQAVQDGLSSGFATLGVCEEEEEGDPIAGAQAALREHTDDASITVRGKVSEHARFGDPGGDALYARESTAITLGVNRHRAFVQFNPQVVLVPGGFWTRTLTGGVGLSELAYDFRTGKASLSADLGLTGMALDPYFGIKKYVEAAFADAVDRALPAEVRGGDYDPYLDPELPRRLAELATSFPACFPVEDECREDAGPEEDLLALITEPELDLSVTARAMEASLEGGVKLKIPAGTVLRVHARLTGTLGQALARPTLEELTVSAGGLSLEHPDIGLIAGVVLHGVTFGPDLSVLDLEYTLGAELLAGAAAQLFGALSGGGAGNPSTPQLTAVRAQLDLEAKRALPALLRDQITQVAEQNPGLPLGGLIGA